MTCRLKSLEMQGYKTFANRTLFSFSEKVTAIVGPNGSGKSNIADSLRWVLGEQSYSLLRGKKTEDMIFSGSELRPRAGMAAATITFDNGDGWLPIDFSEVAITRRAYRDGTNEYLINGQRVRLKDVSELLAQSGLAERTYTIIGQGLVDAALALKAEDRRRLFEEAAGIGLYRTRREEALRRLETTRRNLERVEDILAELEPRLRSLERQARRTQEYEQVKADLQILLRDWYGFHWHRSQQELREAREAERAQSVGLEETLSKQRELDEQLSQLRQTIQGLRQEQNDWIQQSTKLQNQREVLIRDIAVTEERIRSFDAQSQNLGDELSRLQEEFGLQEELINTSIQEVGRLENDLTQAQHNLIEARENLEKRLVERGEVENKIQTFRQGLSNLNNKKGQLEARFAERQVQLERYKTAEENASKSLDHAIEDQGRAIDLEVELRKKLADAELSHINAKEALRVQEANFQEFQTGQKEIDDEINQTKAELERLNARRDVLVQAEIALSGYAEGTRILLQAVRDGKLSGKNGALNQYLDVSPNYETAITAALGEFLEAVLLESGVENALEILKIESGRAALLPMAEVHPRHSVSPLDFEIEMQDAFEVGYIGIAAAQVQTTSEMRPIVDRLLGTVWITKDSYSARQLLKLVNQKADNDLAAQVLRMVTLEGEVFYLGGPVVAGSNKQNQNGKEQSLLSRQRQQKEIGEIINISGSKLEDLRQQQLDINVEYQRLANENERFRQEETMTREDFEQASLAVQQARLAIVQSDKQLNWQRNQLKQIQDEITSAESEQLHIQSDLASLEIDLVANRDQLHKENNLLSSLLVDEYQTQVAHWNTRYAVAERVLSDEKRRLDERRQSRDKSSLLSETLRQRINDLGNDRQILEEKKIELQSEAQRVDHNIENLQEQIEPVKSTIAELEIEQNFLEESETAARQAVSLADHHHAQTRVVLARRQENLEALQRRIEEDFGLVAFEYEEQVSGQAPLPFEGMVQQLPTIVRLAPEIEEAIKRQRAQMRRIGPINPEAQAEYVAVKERFNFMTEQIADLKQAETDIHAVIKELDGLMKRNFSATFEAVAAEFKDIFQRLFGGGSARLVLTDPENLTDTGIDIEARLPGRRTQGLSLLSGGERSLTATSLVFALMKVSPTPFCVLDEVDAMLDEANVGRFRELLRELSDKTQFVIVTHNRNTVQVAEVIYGVTMGRDSASQVISLKMDDIQQVFD